MNGNFGFNKEVSLFFFISVYRIQAEKAKELYICSLERVNL